MPVTILAAAGAIFGQLEAMSLKAAVGRTPGSALFIDFYQDFVSSIGGVDNYYLFQWGGVDNYGGCRLLRVLE